MNKYLKMMAFAVLSVFSLTILSCSDDDSEDTTPIKLYVGDKTVVNDATNLESDNRFVATVTNDNNVVGSHVGETFIKVNGKKRIPVTVMGKFKTYDDPITDWGATQAQVKAKQKQGTLSEKSDNEILAYENAGHADLIAYFFKDGKLNAIITLVSTTWTSEFADYLLERYLMAPIERDNETYFVGMNALELSQASTMVLLQVYNAKYLSTYYTKNENNTKVKSRIPKSERNKIEKIIKVLNL